MALELNQLLITALKNLDKTSGKFLEKFKILSKPPEFKEVEKLWFKSHYRALSITKLFVVTLGKRSFDILCVDNGMAASCLKLQQVALVNLFLSKSDPSAICIVYRLKLDPERELACSFVLWKNASYAHCIRASGWKTLNQQPYSNQEKTKNHMISNSMIKDVVMVLKVHYYMNLV